MEGGKGNGKGAFPHFFFNNSLQAYDSSDVLAIHTCVTVAK